jgi:hypothetical protein
MKLTGPVIVLCATMLASASGIIAQNNPDTNISGWHAYFDRSYGNDYTLINGIRFLQIPARAEGHPFMGENRFSTGRICIGENEYDGVDLKYDICNQQVILNYRDFTGSTQQIVLVSNEINEFTLETRLFRKMELPEKGWRYLQVMEGEPVSCLFYWHKELVKGSVGEYYYRYLPEKRSAYLLIYGELHPFRGKRSFINAFPEKYRKEIKGYFKSSNFLFSEASDSDLQYTLHFCNELMKNGG